MSQPKISIIVPVYKVEQYLHRCLDSIVDQTFTDWECILIDDGSPDNSGKICDEYAEKDRRFKVFHQGNAGVSAARNKGLDEAVGDWIGFVDSDDWIDAETYEVAYYRAIKEGVDLIQWGHCFEWGNKSSKKILPESLFSDRDALIYWDPSMCYKLVSSKIIFDNNFRFPTGIKLSEDRLFAVNCYLKSRKCIYISKCFYHYRMNEMSASHSITKEMIMQEIEVVKKMEPLCGKNMMDFIFSQKEECKKHILFLMNPVDLNLFRAVFSEINQTLLKKSDIKHTVIYYLAFKKFDYLVRLILKIRNKIIK